jgi:hypothetical protein
MISLHWKSILRITTAERDILKFLLNGFWKNLKGKKTKMTPEIEQLKKDLVDLARYERGIQALSGDGEAPKGSYNTLMLWLKSVAKVKHEEEINGVKP